MKSLVYQVSVICGVCALSGVVGQQPAAAGTPATQATVASIVREMDGNAAAAGRNAEVFQWVRVNREVDRVVAGEHRLAQSLTKDSPSPMLVESLQSSVRELRAARLAHDSPRTVAAAKRVIADCRPLE